MAKNKEQKEREIEIKKRTIQTLKRIITELSKPESLRGYAKEDLDSGLPKIIEDIVEEKIRSRLDAEIIWDRANRTLLDITSEKPEPA